MRIFSAQFRHHVRTPKSVSDSIQISLIGMAQPSNAISGFVTIFQYVIYIQLGVACILRMNTKEFGFVFGQSDFAVLPTSLESNHALTTGLHASKSPLLARTFVGD
jgi:hypothetical protein